MKKEIKKRGNLIQKSVNLTSEELIQVENFKANLKAKSLSEAIIILMKKGLENFENTEKLSNEVQGEFLNLKNDLMKITTEILKLQKKTDKNILDLKDVYLKKEGNKKTKQENK